MFFGLLKVNGSFSNLKGNLVSQKWCFNGIAS